ncbi:MAG: isopeptide-forming domain-containing fimbrial protein [Acutalibacteraceae bacterium]
MKKVLSCLTALLLVIALAIPAFAESTGTITIKPADNVSLEGKTLKAYKLLDASFVNGTDASEGVSYTVPDELAGFYASQFTLDKAAKDFSVQVANKILDMSENSDALFAFAKEALAAAKSAGIAGTSGAMNGANYVISGLAHGYYVIEDEGTAKPLSALMLKTSSAEIQLKADKPTVDKEIDGDKDTDDSKTGLVKYNNAAIGDKVPFVVKSTVPATTGYTKYTMVFTDTFSAGLTYNNDLTVTVDGTTVTTGYTAAVSGQTLTVTFTDVKGWDGKKIELNYTATVNQNAVIGTAGNDNTVNLTYSSNPNIDTETETTPDSKTRTFVTEFGLLKVDKLDPSKTLRGVEFELTGTKINKVLVTDDKGTKRLVETTEDVTVKATTDENGKILFTGLSAGTYTLTELKTLDGYNLLTSPITVTIGWTAPADDTVACTWTYSENCNIVDGVAVVTVENSTGTELPSTGGIGTTIFYIVGAVLVLGAAIVLVTRKILASSK